MLTWNYLGLNLELSSYNPTACSFSMRSFCSSDKSFETSSEITAKRSPGVFVLRLLKPSPFSLIFGAKLYASWDFNLFDTLRRIHFFRTTQKCL